MLKQIFINSVQTFLEITENTFLYKLEFIKYMIFETLICNGMVNKNTYNGKYFIRHKLHTYIDFLH